MTIRFRLIGLMTLLLMKTASASTEVGSGSTEPNPPDTLYGESGVYIPIEIIDQYNQLICIAPVSQPVNPLAFCTNQVNSLFEIEYISFNGRDYGLIRYDLFAGHPAYNHRGECLGMWLGYPSDGGFIKPFVFPESANTVRHREDVNRYPGHPIRNCDPLPPGPIPHDTD